MMRCFLETFLSSFVKPVAAKGFSLCHNTKQREAYFLRWALLYCRLKNSFLPGRSHSRLSASPLRKPWAFPLQFWRLSYSQDRDRHIPGSTSGTNPKVVGGLVMFLSQATLA